MTPEPRLVVVGGGPAGLAAAVEAARAGLRTTIVDAGVRLGGQYWRHGAAGLDPGLYHDIPTFAGLSIRARQLTRAGRLRHLAQHEVWTLTTTPRGASLFVADRRDPQAPKEVALTADYLVLATGGYDRVVPFPGWDLPGVMTAGGAQALLKGSGVAVGPRVLVAGTGPFLLPVAAGLAVRGSTVLGVHEANRPARWGRHLGAAASEYAKLGEAAGYAAALARHRIPLRTRSIVVAAHGGDRLEAVTVARLDTAGRVRPGSERRIAVDVLAAGYGFSTQTELPALAGCALGIAADQTVVVRTDDDQATSQSGIYAAGESTGIGGAQLAVVEGRLAGLAVVAAADLPSLVSTADRAALRRCIRCRRPGWSGSRPTRSSAGARR
jgi:NADPH-dependent 2,4-dienoyl-CoA reductase/sulfur reductase-like enzyme